MPSRKKRLKKGVDSLNKQIELHIEKRKKAIEEGKIELEEYYGKEIINLEKVKKRKENFLKK